jgi:hypothetical protein
MKQVVPVLLAIGLVGAGAVFVMKAQQQPQASRLAPTKAQVIEAGLTSGAPEKVVHRFEGEDQLKQFATLWQQRQASLLRMAMIEGYWNTEQGSFNQLNQQLSSQYNIDPAKTYVFSPEQRSIIERNEPAPADPAAAAQATPPATPPADQAGQTGQDKVVHTFADDSATQAFAQLWQQRQSIVVKLAVLKSYWDTEKGALSELNNKLASDYQMDPSKQYKLDDQGKSLIELDLPAETPAGTIGAAGGPGGPGGEGASAATPGQPTPGQPGTAEAQTQAAPAAPASAPGESTAP